MLLAFDRGGGLHFVDAFIRRLALASADFTATNSAAIHAGQATAGAANAAADQEGKEKNL